MSNVTVQKDDESLTMTVTTDLEATPERVWELWADPRQLERWWGPPTYPATVTAHDLRAGGRVEYHMTGPEGDQPAGYWNIVEVDPAHHLAFVDGFAREDGTPNENLPIITVEVTIESVGDGRTRMTIRNAFETVEAMEQLLAMGMEEGMAAALGQIEEILAGKNLSSR